MPLLWPLLTGVVLTGGGGRGGWGGGGDVGFAAAAAAAEPGAETGGGGGATEGFTISLEDEDDEMVDGHGDTDDLVRPPLAIAAAVVARSAAGFA